MNSVEQKIFLSDIRYVMNQASAFRAYIEDGHKKSLSEHPFEPTIHNALLESSLSFLRKINDFFGKKNEANVQTFFPDVELEWFWNNDQREILNDRVMHLSLEEAKHGKYNWSSFYETHLSEAERRFNKFSKRIALERPELF